MEIPAIDVRIEPISPKEFLIDPAANSIDEALGVAHEVIKPRYHVVEGIRSGIYRDVPLMVTSKPQNSVMTLKLNLMTNLIQ